MRKLSLSLQAQTVVVQQLQNQLVDKDGCIADLRKLNASLQALLNQTAEVIQCSGPVVLSSQARTQTSLLRLSVNIAALQVTVQ